MSDERNRGQDDEPPAVVVVRRTRVSAVGSADEQPVGLALLSRSADSRDWADTGNTDYEPALEGASAGRHARDPPDEDELEPDTVMLVRGHANT